MKKIQFSVLETNEHFKILLGEGVVGTQLKPHTTNKDALLFILSGAIRFQLGDNFISLGEEKTQKIPAGLVHSFVVLKDCRFLLTLAANTTMKFIK